MPRAPEFTPKLRHLPPATFPLNRMLPGWGSALRGAFRGSPNPPVEPKHLATRPSVTPPCSPWLSSSKTAFIPFKNHTRFFISSSILRTDVDQKTNIHGFLTRRTLHLPESNGLNTSTPASRKSLVFRVTIRKRWTHAVAANNPSTRVQKPGHPAISYTSVLNCGLAAEGRSEPSECACLQAAPFVAPSTSYRATEKALRHPDVQLAEIVPEIPPIPGQKPVRMNSGVSAN